MVGVINLLVEYLCIYYVYLSEQIPMKGRNTKSAALLIVPTAAIFQSFSSHVRLNYKYANKIT